MTFGASWGWGKSPSEKEVVSLKGGVSWQAEFGAVFAREYRSKSSGSRSESRGYRSEAAQIPGISGGGRFSGTGLLEMGSNGPLEGPGGLYWVLRKARIRCKKARIVTKNARIVCK